MARISYINGHFVPHRHAHAAMEDRGYQFADGVYEVIALYENRLIDGEGHLARLERSLHELDIPMPTSMKGLALIIDELLRLNPRRNGLVYMQVTRGVAPRNHLSQPHKAVLSLSLNPAKYPNTEMREQGVAVITVPDQRWARCDIKSIALLPNVLARRAAQAAGAFEAWQMKEDIITEGSLSNAYIVKEGVIRTHPTNEAILGGITRDVLLRLAQEQGIAVDETAFSLDDALAADEAFLSSASSFVLPVTQVNQQSVGSGAPGAITKQLMQAYDAHIKTQPERK